MTPENIIEEIIERTGKGTHDYYLSPLKLAAFLAKHLPREGVEIIRGGYPLMSDNTPAVDRNQPLP